MLKHTLPPPFYFFFIILTPFYFCIIYFNSIRVCGNSDQLNFYIRVLKFESLEFYLDLNLYFPSYIKKKKTTIRLKKYLNPFSEINFFFLPKKNDLL